MKTTFSIVIPTYNGQATIGRLLSRLRNISTGYSTEVIVVDSSSSDNTPQILSKYKRLLSNMKVITIKKEDFNHGETRNFGARLARGKYVCFFSQDAVPLDGKFFRHFDEDFSIDKKVVAVFGKQVPVGNGDYIQRLEFSVRFKKLDAMTKRGIFIQWRQRPFGSLGGGNSYLWFSLFNTFACYRRSFLLKNPFPKTDYGEDIQLGKRIIEKGFAKIYDSRCKVLHSHNLSLLEYYKRCRQDFVLWSKMMDLGQKVYVSDKFGEILVSKVGLLKKIQYLLHLAFYYLVKVIILFDIKIGNAKEKALHFN